MASLKNTVIDDTGYLGLPIGTTAQRPANPANGYMRINSTTNYIEVYYNGGSMGLITLYGTDLSASQVTQNYDAVKARYGY